MSAILAILCSFLQHSFRHESEMILVCVRCGRRKDLEA